MTVFSRIPGGLPVPIVIVQHTSSGSTGALVSRLDVGCPLKVREGVDGAVLQAGDVWIAPSDRHMVIKRHKTEVVLEINQAPSENSCRPSINPLFRSVARVYGSRSLGIILTGMGCDGEDGSRLIRQAGGKVIVQDEASSVIWGMPRAVVQAGLASAILPLSQIADEITRRSQPVTRRRVAATDPVQ